mmetsp:Transcript_6916/g.30390  ORF Transcript_6916/g.30390 Transcript_6916/m.30390 type:complete len:653 (-) Transcript_6916:209-2167(-)
MRRGRLAGELPEAHARTTRSARRPRRLPARAAILRSRARVVRVRRRRVPVPRLRQTVPRVRQVPQARDGRGSDGVPRRQDPRRSERVAHVRLRAHGARRRGMDPVGHGVWIRDLLRQRVERVELARLLPRVSPARGPLDRRRARRAVDEGAGGSDGGEETDVVHGSGRGCVRPRGVQLGRGHRVPRDGWELHRGGRVPARRDGGGRGVRCGEGARVVRGGHEGRVGVRRVQRVLDGRVEKQAASENRRQLAAGANLRRDPARNAGIFQKLLDGTRGLVLGDVRVQAGPGRGEGVPGEPRAEPLVQDLRDGAGASTRRLARVLARLGSFGHGVRAAHVRPQGEERVSGGGIVLSRRHARHGRVRRRDVGAPALRRVHCAVAHQEQGARPEFKIRLPHAHERRARSHRRHERRRRKRWSRRLRRVVVRQSVRQSVRRTPSGRRARPHRRPRAPGLSRVSLSRLCPRHPRPGYRSDEQHQAGPGLRRRVQPQDRDRHVRPGVGGRGDGARTERVLRRGRRAGGRREVPAGVSTRRRRPRGTDAVGFGVVRRESDGAGGGARRGVRGGGGDRGAFHGWFRAFAAGTRRRGGGGRRRRGRVGGNRYDRYNSGRGKGEAVGRSVCGCVRVVRARRDRPEPSAARGGGRAGQGGRPRRR